METRYIKDVEAYIDPAIEDPFLRAFDWQVTLFVLTDQMEKAMRTKWRRAIYLQFGWL